MSVEKNIKLKQLYQLLPEGVVAPSSWLSANAYSAQLLYLYPTFPNNYTYVSLKAHKIGS